MHEERKPSVFCKNVVVNALNEKRCLLEMKTYNENKKQTKDMEKIRQQNIFAYVLEY